MILKEQGCLDLEISRVNDWNSLHPGESKLARFIYDNQDPIGLIPADEAMRYVIAPEIHDVHWKLFSLLGAAAVSSELHRNHEGDGFEVRHGFTHEGHRLFSLLGPSSYERDHEGERYVENLIVVNGLHLFAHAHTAKEGLVIPQSVRPLTDDEAERILSTDLYNVQVAA